MRNLLSSLILLFLLLAFSVQAIEINPYLSGSWYNPDQDGHGFAVEVLSAEQSVFYWYVYNPDGTPTFLIMLADNVGDTMQGTAYHNSGMEWGVFDSTQRTQVEWGTVDITFNDCATATLNYSSTHNIAGIPSGSGSIPLTRLASIATMQCSDSPLAGIYEGVTTSSDPTEGSFQTTLLVSPDGGFYGFTREGDFVFGTWEVDGQDFTGTGTLFYDDLDLDETIAEQLTIVGKVEAEHRMVLDYSTSGGDSGAADLYALHSLYRRGISRADLRGDWEVWDIVFEENEAQITIRPNGTLTGGDDFGCVYSGQTSIPDTRFNMFELTVIVSECGDFNGTFTGLGYQFDAPGLGEGSSLRILVANENDAGALELRK